MYRNVLIVMLLVFSLSGLCQSVQAANWYWTVPQTGSSISTTSNISCGGSMGEATPGYAFVVEAIKGSTTVQSNSGTSGTYTWSTTLAVPSGNWPVGTLTLKLTAFENPNNTPATRDVTIVP